MLVQFSEHYWLARFYIVPHDSDPSINSYMYGILREISDPVVLKIDEVHLSVEPDESVPEGTVRVPQEMVEGGPTLQPVLVAGDGAPLPINC
jgi:hypothetical protein